MTCTSNKIAPLIRGDTRKIDITITDEFGGPVNIQGHKIYFTLKTSPTLSDALATLQVTSVIAADANALVGKTTLVLSAANTATVPPGKYYYDIQWKTTGGTPEVTTISLGVVIVESDVTISVA